MKPTSHSCSRPIHIQAQRGVALFFALIALLAMSLTAVAMIRSVDTSTMIAGNLAFKQTTAASGDAGIEAAINWLTETQTANNTVNIYNDATHPFNISGGGALFPNAGYYSAVDPDLSLTDGSVLLWDDTDSLLIGTDNSGNTSRYIIQRMCRNANMKIEDTNCLYSGAIEDGSGKSTPTPADVCDGPGCPLAGQTPMIRITTRTTGPNSNTISYIQAFVY